jgi:holo-ACP synthase
MDVINTDGTKLSRPVYRKCLICGKQAQECARSRTHTVKELQDAVDDLLQKHLPHSAGQSR